MRVIIDRFEGGYAVAELDGKMLNVPRELFAGAKEGDAIEITVLGKPIEGEEPPHKIFERLRRSSIQNNDPEDNSEFAD